MTTLARFLTPETAGALGRLGLVAREVVEGLITGLHASPYHGFSVEFAEHRKYVPGDPLRDLDWKAYGRTDRYYIKRYREETNLRCLLLLDASGSMDFGAPVTKLEYARRLLACLAYLGMRQRDAVGLAVAEDGEAGLLPSSSRPAHLARILERLEAANGRGTPPLARALHDAAERMRRRGLVAIVTDALDGEAALAKALRHLRHRRHEVIFFHLLDPAEETLPYRRIGEFVDMETGARLRIDPESIRREYAEAIRAFRERIRRCCSDAGVDHVAASTAEPCERLLLRYLARRARA